MLYAPQVYKSSRSSSHPDEERYCLRGVHGRSKLERSEGCSAQLQVGRREQNQGLLFVRSFVVVQPILTERSRSTDYLRKKVDVVYIYKLLCTFILYQ